MTTYRFTNVPATTYTIDYELGEAPRKGQLVMFPWRIGRTIFRVIFVDTGEQPPIAYITEYVELTEHDTTIHINTRYI